MVIDHSVSTKCILVSSLFLSVVCLTFLPIFCLYSDGLNSTELLPIVCSDTGSFFILSLD